MCVVYTKTCTAITTRSVRHRVVFYSIAHACPHRSGGRPPPQKRVLITEQSQTQCNAGLIRYVASADRRAGLCLHAGACTPFPAMGQGGEGSGHQEHRGVENARPRGHEEAAHEQNQTWHHLVPEEEVAQAAHAARTGPRLGPRLGVGRPRQTPMDPEHTRVRRPREWDAQMRRDDYCNT